MKHLYCALCAFFAATVAVFAQQSPQEEEIITDFGTDEYVYVPNLTLHIGARAISGAKSTFSGKGNLLSTQGYGALTDTRINRNYHDGYINVDSRTILDANGNSAPISPDGKTNSWTYLDNAQVMADGLLAMHTYAVATADTTTPSHDLGNSYGMELTLTRDMGTLFKSRARWGLVAGLSMSDLNASTSGLVPATVTTVTDLYSLDGQVPPPAPYYAPTALSIPVLDSNGNPVLGPSGTALTRTADSSTLLGNQPLDRRTTTASTTVSNKWKLKGSFMTFRFGPTVFVPITEHLSASFSVGAALVYAGSTYTVVQAYKPATSNDIVDFVSDGVSEFLPGFYVDANLNYTFTDTAGMYLGASYQSSGDYTQKISSTTSAYSTHVDLNGMQGLRAGMTFRF
jgi:hypothetical protein